MVRTSSGRAIGRHPHGSRATFASVLPARLAPSRARSGAVPSLLLSVVAVRPGETAQVPMRVQHAAGGSRAGRVSLIVTSESDPSKTASTATTVTAAR